MGRARWLLPRPHICSRREGARLRQGCPGTLKDTCCHRGTTAQPKAGTGHGPGQSGQALTFSSFGHLQAVQPVLVCCSLTAVPRSITLILTQGLCGQGTAQVGPSLPPSCIMGLHQGTQEGGDGAGRSRMEVPRRNVTSPVWEPGRTWAGLTLQAPGWSYR